MNLKDLIEAKGMEVRLVCKSHKDFADSEETNSLLSRYHGLPTYDPSEHSQITEFGAYKITPLRKVLLQLKTVEVRGATGSDRSRERQHEEAPEIWIMHSSLPRGDHQEGSTKILLALELTFIAVERRAVLEQRTNEIGGSEVLWWVKQQGETYEYVSLYKIEKVYKIPLTKDHI